MIEKTNHRYSGRFFRERPNHTLKELSSLKKSPNREYEWWEIKDMTEIEASAKSFVMGSQYRRGVLRALKDESKTASDLSDELDVRIQTTSRALRNPTGETLCSA